MARAGIIALAHLRYCNYLLAKTLRHQLLPSPYWTSNCAFSFAVIFGLARAAVLSMPSTCTHLPSRYSILCPSNTQPRSPPTKRQPSGDTLPAPNASPKSPPVLPAPESLSISARDLDRSARQLRYFRNATQYPRWQCLQNASVDAIAMAD